MKYTVHADKRTSAAYLVYDGDGNFLHDYADDALAEFIQEAMNNYETLKAQNAVLREAIIKTINDNLHLADGDVCTLIALKQALAATPSECLEKVRKKDEAFTKMKFAVLFGLDVFNNNESDEHKVFKEAIEAARAAGMEV